MPCESSGAPASGGRTLFQESHVCTGSKTPVLETPTLSANLHYWGLAADFRQHSPRFSSFQAVGSGSSSHLHGSN